MERASRQRSRFASVSAGVTGGIAILVLAGWVFDVPALRRLLPGTDPLVAGTAISFLLVAISLAALGPMPASRAGRVTGRLAAVGAGAIGLLALAQRWLGWDLAIEGLGSNAGPVPGAIAVPAAAGFVLIATALLVLDVRTRRGGSPAQVITLVAMLFPLLDLVARLYGVSGPASLVSGRALMAMLTGVTFLVVCTGILAARPHVGLMRTLTVDGPGRSVLRRLVPAAVVILVGMGGLRVVGQQKGLYGTEFGVAVTVVGSLTLLTALIWFSARSLDAAEVVRRRTEEGLRSSQKQLAAILSSLGEGVVTTDAEGRVVSINPAMASLAGVETDEVIGKLYEEAFPIEDAEGRPVPPSERALTQAIKTGRVVPTRGYALFLVTEDRRVPVTITAAPILSEDGELAGGVDVLRDVSHEREVDSMKTALVSTASHELRTPLTMIQGFSELLLTRSLEPERSQEAVRQIHDSAARLSRLIDDLLSVARIEAGRLEVRAAAVDVEDIVTSSVAQVAQDRDIRFQAEPNLPKVLADRDQVIRVLTNLLSNSAKYSPPGSPITVRAVPGAEGVSISVEDHGIGMTEQELTRAFDKFSRFERPETRKVGGTGLGLFITKSLVEAQGGRIWAESAPGHGTTFTFTLPPVGDDR